MNKYLKTIKKGDKEIDIDVYDILRAFSVQSHPLGHAIKKLLMAGKRGAKDEKQDLEEAIQAIEKELEYHNL